MSLKHVCPPRLDHGSRRLSQGQAWRRARGPWPRLVLSPGVVGLSLATATCTAFLPREACGGIQWKECWNQAPGPGNAALPGNRSYRRDRTRPLEEVAPAQCGQCPGKNRGLWGDTGRKAQWWQPLG